MSWVSFKRLAKRPDHALVVVFAEVREVGCVLEVLVKPLGSGEVEAESTDPSTVQRLHGHIGRVHQVPGVEVFIFLE